MEREGRQVTRFADLTEFIDVRMQTAIRISYDHDKNLDENLMEYKVEKYH